MSFFPVRKYLEPDEDSECLGYDYSQYITDWKTVKNIMYKELIDVMSRANVDKLYTKLRAVPLIRSN